jgi:cyanate lyase
MSIPQVTQQLLTAKQSKGLSFTDLEKVIGRDEVWIAALFYRQASTGSDSSQTELHIHLQPELVGQVAEASEMDTERLDLVNRFCKQDLYLQHIAMLLLAELRSDSMMG